jgi:hypothetical protein
MIFCSLESLEPNLLEALCQRLPFDVLGFNSPISTSRSNPSEYSLLTLLVLTSDDVYFASGLSENLNEGTREPIFNLYNSLANRLQNQPKLVFLFGPPQHAIRGEHLVKYLVEAAGDCPVFGGLGCDYFVPDRKPFMIFNGKTYNNRAAIIVVDGDIKPKFSFLLVPDRKGFKHRAIVSEVEGNIVKQVNGMPVLNYLTSLGLVIKKKVDLHRNIPIIITYPKGNDSKPMVIMGQTEEGHIICSFDIEENSTLGLGIMNERHVINTINQLTEELKWEQFDFCLILSCITRNLALGLNYLAEFETVRAGLGDLLPYVLTYSGGEAGPVLTPEGAWVTKFHNLAILCCRF